MAFAHARTGRVRRAPRQLEKTEQAGGVKLLSTIGAKVYVLGTRRSRGRPCPKCGTFVEEHQGTRQTPGVGDVLAFLPPRRQAAVVTCRHGNDADLCLDDACNRQRDLVNAPTREVLWWEVKRPDGGRMSPDQREFRDLCEQSRTAHVVGPLDELIAWLIARGYVLRNQLPHYRLPKEPVS